MFALSEGARISALMRALHRDTIAAEAKLGRAASPPRGLLIRVRPLEGME